MRAAVRGHRMRAAVRGNVRRNTASSRHTTSSSRRNSVSDHSSSSAHVDNALAVATSACHNGLPMRPVDPQSSLLSTTVFSLTLTSELVALLQNASGSASAGMYIGWYCSVLLTQKFFKALYVNLLSPPLTSPHLPPPSLSLPLSNTPSTLNRSTGYKTSCWHRHRR
jgi:hypothetical protein